MGLFINLLLPYKNSKQLKHDPVEHQIIKQKQSVNNHSIESYITMCGGASFSSKVSGTIKKNKLFKPDTNQSKKQVSITMKKSKLFKLRNSQSTKQVSITKKKIIYSKSSEGIHSTVNAILVLLYRSCYQIHGGLIMVQIFGLHKLS